MVHTDQYALTSVDVWSPIVAGQAVPVRRPRRHLMILLGIVLLLAGCCAGTCGALSAITWFMRQSEDTTFILDQYIRAMAVGDVSAALKLYSTSGKRGANEAAVREELQGASGALFAGYQQIELDKLQVNWFLSGTVAQVSANATYEGGFTGLVEAMFEREDGAWKIADVSVTVPPEKVEAYMQRKLPGTRS